MKALLDGKIRLTMNEALWLYRKMFPHDISTFTSEERREIANDIEHFFSTNDGNVFDRYHFGVGDSQKQAIGRLKRGWSSMEGGTWNTRSAKGPQLGMGEQADGFVYISAMRAFRLRKGYTCQQFSELVGCSAGHISSIELGKASLTPDIRRAAARALNCAVADLSGFVRIELNTNVETHAPTK